MSGRLAGAAGSVLMLLCMATTARAYAPVDQPGPPLDVPKAELQAALNCPAPPSAATRDVVLLIPGTTVDPDQAYGMTWEPALTRLGMPYCTVTVPNHTDGDIQIAAEYVVYAVRAIASASHHQVQLLGWSQGASTLPRWAIRWWPDIRPQIAGLIGIAPVNNIGSVVANGDCTAGMCDPAVWQQAVGAQFMAALNSGQQTFPGIAYTVIYSRVDDVVTPDVTGALSVLPPGPNVTNVAIQDLCPTDLSDHLSIPASPTAYAVAVDALEHPGEPADLADVHVSQPCLPGMMPGLSFANFLTWEAGIVAPLASRLTTGMVNHEPALRCYVTASCPTSQRLN